MITLTFWLLVFLNPNPVDSDTAYKFASVALCAQARTALLLSDPRATDANLSQCLPFSVTIGVSDVR